MLRSRSPLFAWILLLLLLGCGTRAIEPWISSIESKGVRLETLPSWPPDANTAHVTYLGTIETATTFEGPAGFWKRIWSIVSGSKKSVGFVRPAGLCLSGSMLVVADPGASLLHLLDLETRRWRIVGDTLTGRLVSPVDVACLPEGRILTSDSSQNILFAYDGTGTPIGEFGTSELLRPTGVAFDSILERVWLTETAAHRIRAFDLEGDEILRLGVRGTRNGEFNYPTRISPDGRGGVWLTDSLNFRLQHVMPEGAVDRTLGFGGDRVGTLARPRGLLVDGAGRVMVVDALLDAVQIFDVEGRLLLAFGGRGSSPGQFWLPSGIALDGDGHLFVSDSYNSRVQVFSYDPPADN